MKHDKQVMAMASRLGETGKDSDSYEFNNFHSCVFPILKMIGLIAGSLELAN